MRTVRDGTTAFHMLNGVFCLYKYREAFVKAIAKDFRSRIAEDLNSLRPRPPRERVLIKGDILPTTAQIPSSSLLNDPNSDSSLVKYDTTLRDRDADDLDLPVDTGNLSVELEVKYSDHPLVVGQRYQPRDLSVLFVSPQPGYYTTGVLVGMIGPGCARRELFNQSRLVREYELGGTFGQARHNYMYDGRVVEKSTHKHLTASRIDRACAKFEATQRAVMFETAGLHLRSQDAYEAASRGLIRPSKTKTSPVAYSIKCVHFDPPQFKLRVIVINEYEPFLASIVHELGLSLKSTAYCTAIRCVRNGPFTTDMSLLDKHWTFPDLIRNIQICNEFATEDHLVPKSAFLSDSNHLRRSSSSKSKRSKDDNDQDDQDDTGPRRGSFLEHLKLISSSKSQSHVKN